MIFGYISTYNQSMVNHHAGLLVWLV